jgi:DNA (cytosine-5)-methyltransferase 1
MKVLDLFSGIGGFSLGLERAGFETVAFCEIDPFCQKVLKKHWPAVPIYEDVRNVSKAQLESDGIHGIEVITGGFPCQDLSVAGKQKGITAERSGLWSELARIIGDIRPKYAIVENVTALLSGDRGGWFGRVLGDMAEIGYDTEWHCIPASCFSLPHDRDRVWIIAHPAKDGWSHEDDKAPRYLSRQCLQNYKQSGYRWRREDSGHSLESVGWTVKPRVCGSNDGISEELAEAEIGAYGNSVIPQIPEIIGRAIMEAEA